MHKKDNSEKEKNVTGILIGEGKYKEEFLQGIWIPSL
jgi:hypothetical protein